MGGSRQLLIGPRRFCYKKTTSKMRANPRVFDPCKWAVNLQAAAE